LADPPMDVRACHAPKPILLYTGGISLPSRWSANILPLQLVRLGELYIIAVPSEFTTMAGRRLKDTVTSILLANGASSKLTVVIAGLANGYSQYVTTTEEYAIQRYEGASTLYGPYTLNAYQQQFAMLATALQTNTNVSSGPEPEDFSNRLPDLLPSVVFDDGPIGTVKQDVDPLYQSGDTVSVVFYSGHPRNNYRDKSTFLTVEQKLADGTWKVIATDGNWETKFAWEHITNIELGESYATITWEITAGVAPGTYRIRHFGSKKSIFGQITDFVGTSSEFKVYVR